MLLVIVNDSRRPHIQQHSLLVCWRHQGFVQYATDQPPSKLMTPTTMGITIVPTAGFGPDEEDEDVDEGLVEVAVEVVFGIAV